MSNMKKNKKWEWSWGWSDITYVHHSYFPLSLVIWLMLLFPKGTGVWAGTVVEGFKSVIH